MNRIILGASLLALGTAVSAAEITFYEQENFRGRRAIADTYVNDLANTGFNNPAASVVVRTGTWEACDDANFSGRCVQLNPGEYPSVATMGLRERVASVREVAPAPERARVVQAPPPPLPPAASLPPATSAPPVAALPPSAAYAPPVGSARVVLFDGPNFTGRAVTIDRPVINFSNIGFNDRARSAIVYEGSWELCYDAQFTGRCALYRPGQYASLSAGLDGEVSSARPAAESVAVAPVPVPHSRVTLYARPDFRGRSLVVESNVIRNLADVGFNDRAGSLHVDEGYWLFCSDADFNGECRTFGPGDYASLPRELENHISSGRKISDTFPYRNGPNWGSR